MRLDIRPDYDHALRTACQAALRDALEASAKDFVQHHAEKLVEKIERELVRVLVRSASVTTSQEGIPGEGVVTFRIEVALAGEKETR